MYLQIECDLESQVVSDATSTAYPNTSICPCNRADSTRTTLAPGGYHVSTSVFRSERAVRMGLW
ncbi:MAG: hypothetical protein JXP73_06135 [Deltaproteobacteria bacterium]|nr:hypothetical protein [Deltaproteobacteria bacterium]